MAYRSKISPGATNEDEPQHKGKLLVEKIPATTKSEFKAACARRGIAMRDVVIEFMRAYVAQKD